MIRTISIILATAAVLGGGAWAYENRPQPVPAYECRVTVPALKADETIRLSEQQLEDSVHLGGAGVWAGAYGRVHRKLQHLWVRPTYHVAINSDVVVLDLEFAAGTPSARASSLQGGGATIACKVATEL